MSATKREEVVVSLDI